MATKSQHSSAYQPLMELLRAAGGGGSLTQPQISASGSTNRRSWIHNCEVGNRRVDVLGVRGLGNGVWRRTRNRVRKVSQVEYTT